ncbi:MAG TPA: hypothetical protein VL295_01660, partial [Gemmatimonadales bacterium]|nr:hypothetical protein [Gemmatimonadales bacterium]
DTPLIVCGLLGLSLLYMTNALLHRRQVAQPLPRRSGELRVIPAAAGPAARRSSGQYRTAPDEPVPPCPSREITFLILP